MGFITAGADGGRGFLHPARPDQPNRPPYTDKPESARLSGLRTLGKYAQAGPNQKLELALHHVVPWNVLRDFWNALARVAAYDQLRDFAALFGRAKEQTKYWPTDMRTGRFDDRHGADDFAQALCWWPWNLVRGPKNRTSQRTDQGVAGTDPGEGIDDLSRGNGRNAVHILALVQVGRDMERVTAAGPTLDTVEPRVADRQHRPAGRCWPGTRSSSLTRRCGGSSPGRRTTSRPTATTTPSIRGGTSGPGRTGNARPRPRAVSASPRSRPPNPPPTGPPPSGRPRSGSPPAASPPSVPPG